MRRALAGDFAGLVLASSSGRLLDGFVPTCPTVLLVQGRRYQPAEALQQRGAVLDPTTVGLTSLTESAAQA
ncbi:MAG TPA: hypothetical protein VGO74_08480, partial [Modestobacter sp.]|nr:hypothetical protein [Modestobacter sp.]